jgi:phosphate transport system substrate-binding protein
MRRRKTVKRIMALTAVGVIAVVATVFVAAGASAKSSGLTLKGAGSSFVSPLVLTMVQPYEAATGVHVDYNPVGSGAGITAISQRQVDFGASDAPMTPDQFNGCNGCVQIPWQASGTAFAYNLPGMPPHLKITGPVLANIYLGTVKKWNDPSIKKLNPGVNLPDTDITPIWRSDASGTSYNVTDYMSNVSPAFKSKIGVGTQVNFPVGVGGRGSSGVSAVLSRTTGGIMYADVAFSTKNHFSFFSVKNKAGKYELPGSKQILAAMNTVKHVTPDNKISIVNPPASAKDAYPVSTFTYIIIPTKSPNAKALRSYVFWAMTNGVKKYGTPLRFVQVPPVVLTACEKALKKIQT